MIGTPTQEKRSAFTRSQEDYLKALYLLGGGERPVPTRELAQRLGISSPSVSEMVTRLTAQGLVEHDRYRGQQLTREGRKIALELVRHHRLLEMFLVRVLGYSWDEVHAVSHRSLSEARVGDRLVVQGVSDDDPAKLRELQRRGLVPGTPIAVVAGSEFEGPLEVRIKRRRSSVPLGLARAVFVTEAR